eukprot:COSAG01_NODE_1426_length_10342_cov_22.955091_4_plen_91_part_00
MFGPTVQRLVDAFHSGEEPLSSGHDYRQALEIAIALKLSAAQVSDESWRGGGRRGERERERERERESARAPGPHLGRTVMTADVVETTTS